MSKQTVFRNPQSAIRNLVVVVASAFLVATVCAADEQAPAVETLTMMVGEVLPMSAEEVQRVAIGTPEVIDVTVISERELLFKALRAGETNLVIWDQRGQRALSVTVKDRQPRDIEAELTRLITQLGFPDVSLKQEGNKLFLIGYVPTDADVGRLEQMLSSAYPDVNNLVTVRAAPPAPDAVPQAVQLSVQVIELGKSDLEKLGVSWPSSITLTEQALSAASLKDTIFHIWEKATREQFKSVLNALVQSNRARILAEPKLVTTSGKEATSFMGQEIPIISASTTGTGTGTISSSVQFKQVGITLRILPTVLPDQQHITTHLEVEVSLVDDSRTLTIGGSTIPGTKTRQVQTEVVTGVGETILIAGLLQTEDSNTMAQVPALGSVPVIGRLLRAPEVKTSRTDLLITVTPELTVDKETEHDRQLTL